MGRKADFGVLADLVYEAAVDVTAWSAAMVGIADALGAHATSMEIYDTTGTAPPIIAAPRTDPEWLQIYGERWSKTNIVRERSLALMPVGVPFRCDQLMQRSGLERSSFYNEFWAPQRINRALLMVLAHYGQVDSGVGLPLLETRAFRDGRRAVLDDPRSAPATRRGTQSPAWAPRNGT
jgi:hypothetical protein